MFSGSREFGFRRDRFCMLRNPAAHIYASDWKKILEVAQKNAEAMGVADRYHILPGSAVPRRLPAPQLRIARSRRPLVGVVELAAHQHTVHASQRDGAVLCDVASSIHFDYVKPNFRLSVIIASLLLVGLSRPHVGNHWPLPDPAQDWPR